MWGAVLKMTKSMCYGECIQFTNLRSKFSGRRRHRRQISPLFYHHRPKRFIKIKLLLQQLVKFGVISLAFLTTTSIITCGDEAR